MSAFVLKLIKPVCSFLSYHPRTMRIRFEAFMESGLGTGEEGGDLGKGGAR